MNAHEERLAQRTKDAAHTIALTALVASFRKKHDCTYDTAFNAVMRPVPIEQLVALRASEVPGLATPETGLAGVLSLNARVESFQRQHKCNFHTAFNAVLHGGEAGSQGSVIALNARVESYRLEHGCDFETAFAAVVPDAARVNAPRLVNLRYTGRMPPGAKLVTLHVTSNGARSGTFPSRLKVLSWGVNKTLKGDFIVDEQTVAIFDATQKSQGRARVVLDFEHNTVEGTPEYERSQEPRNVAGFWTPRVVPGEGIFLEEPAWTPSGRTSAHEYEDLSAAPFHQNGRVIGLHSVALTKAGASDFTFY
jgi:hypothetical protein